MEVKSACQVVDFSSCFRERPMTPREIRRRSFNEKQIDSLLCAYGVSPRHTVTEMVGFPQEKLRKVNRGLCNLIGDGWDIGPIQSRPADPEMLEKAGIDMSHLSNTWFCFVGATRGN